MKRDYSGIDLPYMVAHWKIGFAISRLQSAGVWDQLPSDLRKRVTDANEAGRSYSITKVDLDSVSDDAWKHLSEMIGGTPTPARDDQGSGG